MTTPPAEGPFPPAYEPAQPVTPQPYSPPAYPQPVSAQPYNPQPYGQPPPQQIVVMAPARPTSGAATASMVLGIIGLLGGWCLFAVPCILAVILGHVGMSQTKTGERGGRGMAVTGLVLGYIGVAPGLLFSWMVFFGAVMGAVNPTPTFTPTP